MGRNSLNFLPRLASSCAGRHRRDPWFHSSPSSSTRCLIAFSGPLRICTRVSVCVGQEVRAHTHTWTHAHTHIRTHARTRAPARAATHTHSTRMLAHKHTHTHTHTQIHTYTQHLHTYPASNTRFSKYLPHFRALSYDCLIRMFVLRSSTTSSVSSPCKCTYGAGKLVHMLGAPGMHESERANSTVCLIICPNVSRASSRSRR